MYDSVIFTEVTDNIDPSKPLGAYKCGHCIREAGYSCLVVDNFHSFSVDELLHLIDLVVGPTTKLIGISNTFLANSNVQKNPDGSTPPYTPLQSGIFFPQGAQVQSQIIEAIKHKNPNTKIMVGGSRSNPNETNRDIDYVCIGYSEVSIVNLMDHLAKGHRLNKSQKNIWGVTIIDDRKAEGYDFANSTMAWTMTDVINAKVLPLEVARGCIFKCKFCAYPMNGKQQLDFIRSPEQLRYEMEKNYEEFGVFRYMLVDDTFNDNDHKLDLVYQAVKTLKFQPEFWAYTRLDLIARNPIRNFGKLVDIGLRSTFFGIETLDESAGRIIGKGYSRRRQIEAVQHIKDTYKDLVSMHGSFIVGLPGEDEKSCRQTLEILQSQEFPLHSWWFNGLQIRKSNLVAWNSELALNSEQYGYIPVEQQDDSSTLLKWKNKDWTSESVLEVAHEINVASQNGGVMRLPNYLGWSLISLGYSPEFITGSIFNQINWNEIEMRKSNYMQEYKNKLFSIIEQQNLNKNP
jgi:lipoate synthase